MNISLLILLGVFLVIAFRTIGGILVKIWHAMTAGAVLVLVTGQISPHEAMEATNLEVMLFLFGMFVVGEALTQEPIANSHAAVRRKVYGEGARR
jgi:Na+/H+ antiporter NhaD/arsenite permease-like protein